MKYTYIYIYIYINDITQQTIYIYLCMHLSYDNTQQTTNPTKKNETTLKQR